MKPTVLILAALLTIGCATKAQDRRGTNESQRAAGIAPCDTDSDCETKNPQLSKTSDKEPGGAVHQGTYCDAIGKNGHACHRRVKEAGLLCWQHSREFNDPKTKAAFLVRQKKA